MITRYDEIVRVENIATLANHQKFEDNPNLIQTNPRSFADIPLLVQRERIILPACYDEIKVLLVLIDPQNDFMESIGSLGVPGSKGDIERVTKWLYKNGHKVTRTMTSLDTHTMMQIFFPCWWSDANGKNPDPYTIITYDDVVKNKWIPNFDKTIRDEDNPEWETAYCKEYLFKLEAMGKYKLCIWPYHTLDGTIGANVETELSRMIYFHSLYRKSDPLFIRKGMDPWSEMYGIIEPEWSYDGYINMQALNEMSKYDIVIFAGEASSHCVGQSGLQTLEYFRTRGPKRPKFVFLKDCMSPVVGFEETEKQIFKVLQEEYGALVVNSTDFVL